MCRVALYSQTAPTSSTIYYERDPNGRLLVLTNGSTVYYYDLDGHGSAVNLTDSSGTIQNQYRYDPYGNLLVSTQSASIANPWRYAGGYYESENSLYLLGVRYYWPARGVFLQPDPAGSGSSSQYAYAGGDPCNNSDPSGMLTCSQTMSPQMLRALQADANEMIGAGTAVGLAGTGLGAVATATALIPIDEPLSLALVALAKIMQMVGGFIAFQGIVASFVVDAVASSAGPNGYVKVSYTSPSIGPFTLPCPDGWRSSN